MKNVALIYGGEGAERDISRISARSLYELIDKEKYRVIPVFISSEGSWYIAERDPFGSLPTLASHPTFPVRLHGISGLLSGKDILKIDCAVPMLHGDYGEDGIIQGALRASHIAFIGADVCEGALSADKLYTKLIARALGIPTADFVIGEGKRHEDIIRTEKEVTDTLGFPVFIKPARLGSSIGAAAVWREEDFIPAYTRACAFGCRVLIERLIDVDYELECALLGIGGELRFSTGIIRTNGTVYGYREKYKDNSIKCEANGERTATVLLAEEYARELAESIGLRSIARIDFLTDKEGKLFFNEINTMPGMTGASLYPRLTEQMGLSRGEFINGLIAEAIRDGNI